LKARCCTVSLLFMSCVNHVAYQFEYPPVTGFLLEDGPSESMTTWSMNYIYLSSDDTSQSASEVTKQRYAHRTPGRQRAQSSSVYIVSYRSTLRIMHADVYSDNVDQLRCRHAKGVDNENPRLVATTDKTCFMHLVRPTPTSRFTPLLPPLPR
jgi:hypothetical protein